METKTAYVIIEDEDESELIEVAVRETELSYDCIIAGSIERAKERLSKEPDFKPDYIFIDWNADLLKFIKGIPHLTDAQTIIYASDIDAKGIREAREGGASHCVLKTTHDTALSKVLQQLFSEKHVPYVLVYAAEEERSSGYVR